MILFTMNMYDRDRRKKPKKRNHGKDFPRLVALPSPRQRNGGRLFSGVRKHRKQAEPTLGEERDPSLVEQIQGWVRCGYLNYREYELYTCEISSSVFVYHHVVPLAQISLTLSRHFSLSFIASGRSSELHPVSSHSCCVYFRASRPAFARPYVGVHWSTSLMSSSLLLQHCPACLVRLAWIVFVMGGRWPYS